MATYFHGSSSSSEIQAAAPPTGGGGDSLQTLILMNPTTGYVGFSSDRQQQPPPLLPGNNTNFVFFNSSNTPGGNSLNFIHAPPPPPPSHNHHHHHQLVGIPLTPPTINNNHPSSSPPNNNHHHQQDFLDQYNQYTHNFDHDLVARETTRSQQGLSLGLSSSQQPAYGSFHEVPSQPLLTTISAAASGGDGAAGASSSAVSGISNNNVNGMQQGVLLNSKYLKAAQELLDEVVNVNKGLKSNNSDSAVKLAKNIREESSSEIPNAGENRDNSAGKLDNELTTTERQEIQMKKAKLVNMIDEVEQRYRQYHHQMQIVISWFEQAAGIGSAKTYTALALQTISKQFRCLKDAILGQIRAASKKLGEEDSFGGKTEGSRLKFIDNQLRQQRALQQLGMVQHNAWRPQRGLPERSVSVLRAWLFEHFLHPYPKESDKFMLAKQTGLTRSQVSNWFINARVRLWKPMVEEMYTEEMKDQEKKGNVEKSGESENNQDSVFKTTSPEKTSSFENQNKTYIPNQEHVFNQNIASPNSVSHSNQNHSGFNLIGSPEMESMTQGSPKKPRASVLLHSSSNVPSISMDENHADLNNGHLLMGGSTNFIEGFGSYPIAELGERFSAEQFQSPYSGNGFSLTLGLPQWENLTMPGSHQPFLQNQNIRMSRGVEIGDTAPTSNDSIGVYDNINIQDRKRLAGQMLQDFVA